MSFAWIINSLITEFCFENSYKGNIILPNKFNTNVSISLSKNDLYDRFWWRCCILKYGESTLTNRFKAVFFWELGIIASVNDCAALLNSTFIKREVSLTIKKTQHILTCNGCKEILFYYRPRIFLHVKICLCGKTLHNHQ